MARKDERSNRNIALDSPRETKLFGFVLVDIKPNSSFEVPIRNLEEQLFYITAREKGSDRRDLQSSTKRKNDMFFYSNIIFLFYFQV